MRADTSAGPDLLEPLQHHVPFPLETPTVLEQNSYPDIHNGDKAVRLYWIEKHHKAVRLVFRTGGNQYWGIEETNWADAPALGDKSFRTISAGASSTSTTRARICTWSSCAPTARPTGS